MDLYLKTVITLTLERIDSVYTNSIRTRIVRAFIEVNLTKLANKTSVTIAYTIDALNHLIQRSS